MDKNVSNDLNALVAFSLHAAESFNTAKGGQTYEDVKLYVQMAENTLKTIQSRLATAKRNLANFSGPV